jgi:hypothetical protein
MAARFHAGWLKFLLNSTPQTLKRVCHEISALEEANAKFRDGAIFGLLRSNLEFVIAEVTQTDWTVARSRKDLRGRIRGRGRNSHDRVRVDPEVRQALWDKLSIF